MKPNQSFSEDLTRAMLRGIGEVQKTADAVQKAQKIHARATYDGLTSSGESRYVSKLLEAYGSQTDVADELSLSRGRISH